MLTVWEILEKFSLIENWKIKGVNSGKIYFEDTDYYKFRNILFHDYWDTEEELTLYEDISEKAVLKIDLMTNEIIIEE